MLKNKAKRVTNENLAISLEDLATAVAKGFEQTASKFELAEVNEKVDAIQTRLDQVAYKFEVQDLQNRVTKLEQKLT